MKGYKFYLEYPSNKDKRKGKINDLGNHSGNVCAIILDTRRYGQVMGHPIEITYDAISGLTNNPNSEVCSSEVSQSWLSGRCKDIQERIARMIHPALFRRLDGE